MDNFQIKKQPKWASSPTALSNLNLDSVLTLTLATEMYNCPVEKMFFSYKNNVSI